MAAVGAGNGSGADNGLWIRRYQPAPQSRLRLVCLPHAGGAASYFLRFSQAFPSSVEVVAVQYPGRQDRRTERCIDNIAGLADEVFLALQPWADRPLALFGHSLGAVVGFEVARRFEAQPGATPIGLFASARRAPSLPSTDRIHLLSDDEIVAEIQRLDGTQSQLLMDEELLRMVLPAIRADYKAIETYAYQPGARIGCPITALVGDRDHKVAVDDARLWREQTRAEFDCQVFPGGHFYLAECQNQVVDAVLDRLGEWTGVGPGLGSAPGAPTR